MALVVSPNRAAFWRSTRTCTDGSPSLKSSRMSLTWGRSASSRRMWRAVSPSTAKSSPMISMLIGAPVGGPCSSVAMVTLAPGISATRRRMVSTVVCDRSLRSCRSRKRMPRWLGVLLSKAEPGPAATTPFM